MYVRPFIRLPRTPCVSIDGSTEVGAQPPKHDLQNGENWGGNRNSFKHPVRE
jgi:hypothetical protein